MAENEDDDRIEKIEIAPASAGEGYTLSVKTKSEEFEFLADRDTLQELADQIYEQLDKDEPKKA